MDANVINMERQRDLLCNELYSHVNLNEVAEVLKLKKPFKRMAKIKKIVYNAAMQSSLCHVGPLFYFFNGKIYEEFKFNGFIHVIYSLFDKLGFSDEDRARADASVGELIYVAKFKEFVVDSSMVAFRNCVLNVRTGEMFKFSPEWKIVSMVNYDYSPDATAPMWDWFLERVLPNNESQRVLQEFIGATFLNRGDDCVFEHMLILHGSGRNGKSVVCETITALLGDENVSSFGVGDLISNHESARSVAQINGKRLNYCNELQLSYIRTKEQADKLKTLISGQPMIAKMLYENPYVAKNIPLIMANTNELPNTVDTSDGLSRKLITIPFEVRITDEECDPQLPKKLKKELSGIFNWVMEGMQNLVKRKYNLAVPDELRREVSEWMVDNSNALQFMQYYGYESRPSEQHVEPLKVKASVLYAKYTEWCAVSGIMVDEILNSSMFGRKLKASGYIAKREESGTMYRIYGNKSKIMSTIDYERVDMNGGKRKRISKQDLTPFIQDGRRWVRTREGLANALNTNESVVQKMISKGMLDKFFRLDGTVKVYDVEESRGAYNRYMKAKKKQNSEPGNRKKINIMRASFNQRMKELGAPYRKYADNYKYKNGECVEGIIRVDDDFELTEAELRKFGAQKVYKCKKEEGLIDFAIDNYGN